MRHFDELQEGDPVAARYADGTPALQFQVIHKDLNEVRLKPWLGEALYKLDRYTKKLYRWTPTGWDTVTAITVGHSPNTQEYYGD